MKRFNRRRLDQTAMQKHELYKQGRNCPEVTCLTFGKDWKKEFPLHFFCHGCDLLEDAVLSNMKSPKLRTMKKYMCTAGHTDLCHPSTLKKQYRSNQMPKAPPATTAVPECGRNCGANNQIQLSLTKSPRRKKKHRQMQRHQMHQERRKNSSLSSGDEESSIKNPPATTAVQEYGRNCGVNNQIQLSLTKSPQKKKHRQMQRHQMHQEERKDSSLSSGDEESSIENPPATRTAAQLSPTKSHRKKKHRHHQMPLSP
jgi:hypothetical protein